MKKTKLKPENHTGQKIYAEKLRQLRSLHNKSLRDMALETGMDASNLGYYERGDREPGLDKLTQLADYYKVSLDYLCGRTNYSYDPSDPFWKSVHQQLSGIKAEDKERVRKMITSTIQIL